LAPKKCKGTPLKVFSGKEATLNHIILLILRSSKQPLTRYDVYLQIRRIRGLKRKNSKTVYRRMEALSQEGWITQNGTRPAKVKGDSILYELTLKGKAALRLEERSIEEFLKIATDEQLALFITVFSGKINPESRKNMKK
jgi:DNA-binding PadR family transcriptional regulator